MRIKRISIWIVELTSHEVYYMADSKTCATVETVVIRIETDSGISGWGEVCPIPGYLPAYARGVAPAVEEIASTLLGCDEIVPEKVIDELDLHLKGHKYAKSALDIALWDIFAKAVKLPLHALLGGRRQVDMPLYHSITCIEPEEMSRIARDVFDQGIRQIQVKLGADNNWRNDVERLIKVREAVSEDCLVYGDWNCGASQLDATRVGRSVSHMDVMLEQPCENIVSCASVRQATGLAMKLDESVYDTASLLHAYQLGCMDAAAIKLSKFGGVSASRRARDLCLHLGTKMCIEDTWGSDITTAAVLHLGVATRPQSLMNVCDLSGYVHPRLDPNIPVRKNGRIVPPDGIGLGVEPDLDLLGEPKFVFD